MGLAVILGAAPAREGARAWSADSGSGQRLATLAGCTLESLPRSFALDNLCARPAPSRAELRDAAAAYHFLPECDYALAGTEVLRAFGKRTLPAPPEDGLSWSAPIPPLTWYRSREGILLAVLPHPSGRSRWYNDRRRRQAAADFLEAARWDGLTYAHNHWLTLRLEALRKEG